MAARLFVIPRLALEFPTGSRDHPLQNSTARHLVRTGRVTSVYGPSEAVIQVPPYLSRHLGIVSVLNRFSNTCIV